MAEWLDLLTDSKAIRAVYGDELPTLEGVDLLDLRLHRDGPRLLLKFDLAKFPRVPPRKWVAQGLNVVRVELSMFSLNEVAISGFSRRPVVDIILRKNGDDIELVIDDEAVRVKARAEFAVLGSMEAFLSGDLPPSRQ